MEVETKELTFSNTRIQTFLDCPAKYYWKYQRNLIPATKSDSLIYGELIHKLFENFFLSYKELKEEKESYERAKEIFIVDYRNSNIQHSIKTIETGLTFLNDLIDLGLHFGEIIIPEQRIEKRLFSFFGRPVSFNGKVDLEVWKNNTREIYDFKTVARLDGRYYPKQEMTRQFPGYCYLTDTEYINLIPCHCVKKPKVYAPYALEYSKDFINYWAIETIAIIRTILEKDNLYTGKELSFLANSIYPKSHTTCSTGNFGCDYTELCKQGCLESAEIGPLFMEREEPELRNL